MSAVLIVVVVAAIAAPHLLSLDAARPATAAAIWMAALCLRALTALFAVVYVVFYLPATGAFDLLTHWCWDSLPLVASELGLTGHRLGDLALLVPAFGLATSLVWVCVGLCRAARAVGGWIERTLIGPGPHGSLVVGERDVVVAAAGLRRPRVIVSAGALTMLDDDELAAGLDHEHGHIARRHRYALLAAEVSRALARLLPGTRRAVAELTFHLERDADRWALQRRHDPIVLASAICKVAVPRLARSSSLLALNGRGVAPRVCQLLSHRRDAETPRRHRLDALAAGMAILVVVTAVTLPITGVAGATASAHSRHGPAEHHCDHS